MKKEDELVKLQYEFNSASKLIRIMSNASEEYAQFLDTDILKNCHLDMAYALRFVADVLKMKSDDLLSIIDEE